MMIPDILTPARVRGELRGKTKDEILDELGALVVADLPGLDPKVIAGVLRERERLNSTGIHGGVAIPHGKLAGLGRIVAAFGRSAEGVDFDSVDGQPTRLFFVLVAPEEEPGPQLHLRTLARVSRLLKTDHLREQLFTLSDSRALYDAIVAEDAKF